MGRFFKQIFLFFIIFGLIFLVGIFLPVTPGAKSNMLSYKVQKDSLLQNVASPRIIFIGGSNLVFGLNSQMIKDSLKINPINNGLAASMGLIYMMDDVLPYIRSGDYVVLAPEYQNFYGSFAYGGNDLLRLLMDVQRSGFYNLRRKQWANLIKSWPTYFMTKFRYRSYFFDSENDIYGKHIFNEYGDSDFHWNLEKQDFPPLNPIDDDFNLALIDEILDFKEKINKKGAILLVTYPSCQTTSIDINKDQVNKIREELEETELLLIGTPQRYGFPDSLMFNQVYHLTKEGVDKRTQFLIEDINDLKK